jgi:hypothetical protein
MIRREFKIPALDAAAPSLVERVLCGLGFHAWVWDRVDGTWRKYCRRCPRARVLDRESDTWRDTP